MSEPTTSQKEQSSNQDEPAASQPVDPSEASLVAAIQRLADSDNDSRWDISTKRTVLVIMLVGIVFIGYVSRPIIPMVLVAFILAYLLNPIVNLAERVRIPRPISTIFIYLLVVVLLLLVPIIFIPTLINQLRTLATFDVSSTALGVLDWANDSIQGLPPTLLLLGFEIPMTDLIGQVEQNMQEIQFVPSVNDILNYIQQFLSTTTNVVSSTATIGFSVVGGIFSVFLAILVTFFVSLYMTMDAPRIQAYFQGLFPTSYQSELAELLRRIGHTWQSFLRGQLILSITVGFTIGVSLSLVGMPGALIFGILAGLLEVVPNLGPIISMIPAVITALIQGSDVLGPIGIGNAAFALITVGIYFVVQQLENNILVPRIIGDSINLHPIVVICAVAVGLSVGGILGALLAPPVVATFRVIGGYVHAKLLDYPPFQQRPEQAAARTYRRKMSRREIITYNSPAADRDEATTESEEASPVGEMPGKAQLSPGTQNGTEPGQVAPEAEQTSSDRA